MVFTASAQLFVVGVLSFLVERFGISAVGQTELFVGCDVVYTILFLWLTWRKISNLEVRQLVSEGNAASESLAARGWQLDWLRCRSTSRSLNLVRKEVQLQKPLFLLAATLCAVWAFVGVMFICMPSRATFLEVAFVLSIFFYVPLLALLGGSVSLGEEKNLGVTAWHLTFPISVRRQWAVKLGVALAAWFVLGIVLPYALTCIGVEMSKRGALTANTFNGGEFETWFGISLIGGGLFAVSFWAMTLFSNTLRAVIRLLVDYAGNSSQRIAPDGIRMSGSSWRQ
jgi:hypothetical protein